MTSADDLQTYLRARRGRIDAALEQWLPAPPASPAIVCEAMRYSVFAGGKRFRPILTLTAAEAAASHSAACAAEQTVALALPCACAIEFIHTYSLIHDDLPAMDNDTLRRGRLTSHVKYGEGIAILAGDALLTEAFHLAARMPETDADTVVRRKIRAIRVIAEAAGAEGMVGGQAIDLKSVRSTADTAPAGQDAARIDREQLQLLHAMKTGALIRAAAVTGVIMAGGSDELVTAVDKYAADLGLAFQIVDDILDVEGTAEQIGKTAGKDAASGKPTYPALYGTDESRRLAATHAARARETLAAAGLGGRLGEIAEWIVTRKN